MAKNENTFFPFRGLLIAWGAVMFLLLVFGTVYVASGGFGFAKDKGSALDNFCRYEGYDGFASTNLVNNIDGLQYLSMGCNGGGDYKIYPTRKVVVNKINVVPFCSSEDGKYIPCDGSNVNNFFKQDQNMQMNNPALRTVPPLVE